MKPEKLKFYENSLKNYNFKFSSKNTPYLLKLKMKYKLDSIVSNQKNELQTAKELCIWVSKRWQHLGTGCARKLDAISILEEAGTGGRFKCLEYAIVLQSCLSAFGFKARILSLMLKDIETVKNSGGHVVVEAYLETHKKWVVLDPTDGMVPILGAIPINAVELQKAITERNKLLVFYGKDKNQKDKYMDFVYPHLFFFRTRINNTIPIPIDNRRKRLLLAPIGYKIPLKMEGYPLKNSIGTHSLKTFYQEP